MAASAISNLVNGPRRNIAALCSAILSPGHIIEMVAAGTCRKSTLTANQPRYIAVNDSSTGQSVGTAFAAGARVESKVYLPGDTVYVMCPTGLTITKELILHLDGAGRATTVTTNAAFARAKEAVTTSADTLVLMELL